MITLLLLVRATYIYGVVLHAYPVRGESHNQCNTTGEVATKATLRRMYRYSQICMSTLKPACLMCCSCLF